MPKSQASSKSISSSRAKNKALGLTRILTRSSNLFAIYVLDFVLPQVSKLSKCLQSQNLDLTIISSLVDATVHTLDDVIQPAANWLSELLEVMNEMESTIGIKFTTEDITAFQSSIAKPFITVLKENVQNQFSSHHVVSIFNILDPNKVPKDTNICSTYGDKSIKTLPQDYGRELPAQSAVSNFGKGVSNYRKRRNFRG